MRTAYDIILRPIISEQSMEHVDIPKYVFEVAKDANKIEIKKAVEEIFGVEVEKVNTLRVKGKLRRQSRGSPEGYSRSWKKAVVRLTPDSKTIEFFEGMA